MAINLGIAKAIAKSTSITYGSIGIVNIVFVEPNIFRFTLADSTVKDVVATNMNAFTVEEKAKLTSLDATILTKFTLDVDGNLLYNGKSIGSFGEVKDSTINGNILINDVETNVYTHPTTHSPSIIEQDSSNRFVTDTEKTNWNSASTNSHIHTNEAILDNTTASYTSEEKTKLSGIEENANNYVLPIANSSIGGVKSGTDITVDASGNVSVNDDSHNHIIDNVDGLQTALDNRYTKLETLSKDEINTLVNSIANGMNWKEKVTEVADLPLTGNTESDTRVVTSTSTIYIWNGTSWVNVGSSTSVPMASATNSGQMSATQYSKLESIVIENLATVSGVNTLLTNYVLKDGTKVLSDENYTTTEKIKLSTLSNYDDTTVKGDISTLQSDKVDKVTGKSLVSDTEIAKIHSHANLTNLEKIGENAEGHLTYNGTEITGGSGATIDDVTPSATTTYSSNKIDILTENKLEISNLIGGENVVITSENGNVTFSSPTQISDSTSVLDKSYSSSKINSLLDNKADTTLLNTKVANAILTSETYTDTAIGNLSMISMSIVTVLPTVDIKTNIIYLVADEVNTSLYHQYAYINGAWASLGDTEVDVTNYLAINKLVAGDNITITNNSGTVTISASIESTGVAPKNVTGFVAISGDEQVTLKWSDPADTVVDSTTICAWAGTKIIRKIGSYPSSITDGIQIVATTTRDEYKTNGFVDTTVTNGVTYYYQAFPYSDLDVVNSNVANRITVTPDIIYPSVATNISASSGNAKVTITYTTPSDCTGVRLVYKTSSYPTNITDGTIIENYVGGTEITGLTNNTPYYFRLFPYNANGRYQTNESQEITATPASYVIYGVRIDETNSNPETALTYTDTCVGMTAPLDLATILDIKPCLLKNGVVQCYLNKNNYTKDINGNTVDITSGSSGDVMVEIPKMGYSIVRTGNYLDVKVTKDLGVPNFSYKAFTRDTEGDRDKLYISAYLGYYDTAKLRSLSGKTPTTNQTIGTFRTQAQANGTGYDLMAFYPLTLLQCLFIIQYKNLDSQTALGRGYVDSNTASITTGNTNTKGMNFGETTGKLQTKFLGIEDFWGNLYYWIDGLVSDASWNICTATKSFNDTGSGYSVYSSGLSANTNGYINKSQGTNDMGFNIKDKTSGSATTYYCDSANLSASCLSYFGGFWNIGSSAGVFRVYVAGSASVYNAGFGGRLMYL